MCKRKMINYATNLVRIGTSCAHTILCFTHFTRCNHFHCARNFLRVLNTTNLCTNLFSTCHGLNSESDYYLYHLILPGRAFFELIKSRFHSAFDFVIKIASVVNFSNEFSIVRLHICLHSCFKIYDFSNGNII